MNIFFASSSELKDERNESIIVATKVNKLFPGLHINPVLFELDTYSGNTTATGRIQDPINVLLDSSDVVVIIFYSRVGIFTKEEFDRAVTAQKKIFLYFKRSFSPATIDEVEQFREILRLKKEIEKQNVIRYQEFNSADDFHAFLYEDLIKYFSLTNPDLRQSGKVNSQNVVKSIPSPPIPYFLPAFGISKMFTGRQMEMDMITQWISIEEDPVCVMEAMGGIGKSSLVWKWLETRILPHDNRFEEYSGVLFMLTILISSSKACIAIVRGRLIMKRACLIKRKM